MGKWSWRFRDAALEGRSHKSGRVALEKQEKTRKRFSLTAPRRNATP